MWRCFFLLLVWICCFCGAARPNKEIIEGTIIRVPGLNIPPFIYPIKEGRDRNVTYGGILMEALNWMTARYKITFHFVESGYTTTNNLNVTTGELKLLEDNVVDLFVIPTAVKWERTSKVSYAYPNVFEAYRLLQKYPEEESRLKAILKPFSLTVWLCSVGIIVAFIMVLTVFTVFQPDSIEHGRKLSAWGHLNHHFEYIAAIIAYQGYYVLYTAGRPFYILCGCWALMMLVLTYAYSGNLTSCLVTPIFQPLVSSLDDIASMDKKVGTISFIPMIQSLMNASSGPSKYVGDYLRNNPHMIGDSFDKVLTNILEEDCVIIGQETIIRVLIGSDLKRNKKCSFTFSPVIWSYIEPYSFAMVKGNPFVVFISDSIMAHWESGLTKHWSDNYYVPIDACRFGKDPPRSANAPLNLIDLSSAFLFLAFGVGLSLVVFLMEHVVSVVGLHNKLSKEGHSSCVM